VDYLPGEKCLRGLYMESSGILRTVRHLPMERIKLLGRHAVVLEGSGALRRSARPVGLLGMPVYSPDGRLLGRLGNLILDPAQAQVKGLQVQRSLWEDMSTRTLGVAEASNVQLQSGRIVLYSTDQGDDAERK
jgi:sporulation protein YlmC with PRC-barrel domain